MVALRTPSLAVPSSAPPTTRVGLALSGGGYRAAAFHLGTLTALHELDLLKQVEIVSSVSGGSIIAGAWLDFLGRRPEAPFEEFRKYFTDFLTRTTLDVGSVIEGGLDPFHKDTDYLIDAYRDRLFADRTLSQLPLRPTLCINATSLNTGKDWKFYRDVMGDWWFCRNRPKGVDWKAQFYASAEVPIAIAVAASSCFPPVFAPVILSSDKYFPDQASIYPYVALADGGIYDNQGLNALFTDGCTHIVASDGSKPFDVDPHPGKTQLLYFTRAPDIMSEKLRAMEFTRAIDSRKLTGLPLCALFSLDSRLPDELDAEVARCNVPTRLAALSEDALGALVEHGRLLATARVQKYLLAAPATDVSATSFRINEHRLLEDESGHLAD